MKRNRRPWPTQDRKRELAEEGALWERYAIVRAEAKAASLRAFEMSRDPNTTPEERKAAWNEAKEAGMRRVEAHPNRARRQKETSHHES